MALLASAVLAGACDSAVNAPSQSAGPFTSLRLAIAATAFVAPGAVVEGMVLYTRQGAVDTIGADSVTVNTGVDSPTLAVRANVGGCVSESEARGRVCTVSVMVKLWRQGRMLDEVRQDVSVPSGLVSAPPLSVQLYEVQTVRVAAVGAQNPELGDSAVFSATGLDRSGASVLARNVQWELLSGGATINSNGVVRGQSAGPARIRATVGGRTGVLDLTVRPASVASIELQPVDTTVILGTSFPYRVTVRSRTGAVMVGRVVSFLSSNSVAAPVSVLGGVVTANGVGQFTVNAQSVEGVGGSVVTSPTAVLRVEPLPPVLINGLASATISLDSVAPGSTVTLPAPVVSTSAGRTLRGLAPSVTYSPNVVPWLTTVLAGQSTPTSLSLQAVVGTLAPGTYTADVRVASSDPSTPALLRVSIRVVAPSVRIELTPKSIQFPRLPFCVLEGSPPSSAVSVTSSNGSIVSGLTFTTEWISGTPNWLSGQLASGTASPSTTMTLRDLGNRSAGSYTARVIVRSTTPGVLPDTVNVSRTIGGDSMRISPQSLALGPVPSGTQSPLQATVRVGTGFPSCLPPNTSVSVVYLQGQLTNWLSATLGQAQFGLQTIVEPAILLQASAASLPAGTYNATVIAASTSPGVAQATLDVTLQVSSGAPPLGVGFGSEQFASIPTGSYIRGSATISAAELPLRTISISAFRMQKTEVTQGQWRQVMSQTALANPSSFTACGDTCPVERVSWDDIQTFLSRLNQQDPGKGYRLPSEAEWEYATRAGATGDFNLVGQPVEALGWIATNSQGRTWVVAQKLPNAFGLFDTHGNVQEWVNDWYDAAYYGVSPLTNPLGPVSGTFRANRGGSWVFAASNARSAYRDFNTPSIRFFDLGFRLARNP